MGLLQKACETYDCHARFAGMIREGHEPLAPVSHILTRADVELTVDADGGFVRAVPVDKKAPKILIPVTEGSGGRTSSKACAHPLCDKLEYFIASKEKKYRSYVEQLENWVKSEYCHPKLPPILAYVKRGTILFDLAEAGIVKLDSGGKPDKEKLLICWRVIGLSEEESGPCWTDQSLFQSFIDYYGSRQTEDVSVLCMITGNYAMSAKQHPKGIIPSYGNAKLISANDSNGFTYRGRFSEDWQAATVSYTASQKAHNALRWIAADQGTVFGGRTFLCWNPQGKTVPQVARPFRRKDVTESAVNPTEYKKQLQRTLTGFQSELKDEKGGVVIAAFDAATTGRLAMTYYNELQASDFLQRLYDWDEICCWENGSFGVQSPGLWQIVDCAFGTQREEKGKALLKTDDRVMRQQMQRLIACRIDRARMPADIRRALVQRASMPLAYELSVRRKLLFTACAVIRKYHYDQTKEEWNMALEPDRKDRSYQFGRLLAVFEKAEADTYQKDEDRETNAIRMQAVFVRTPLHVAMNVEQQLEKAYFPRLSPGSRGFYKKLIGEIMEQIHEFSEEEWNRPLGDSYLMGYYLQRNELYKSRKDNDTEEKNDEHFAE